MYEHGESANRSRSYSPGEIAVRLAFGSSRLRMVRQLVTESLLLAGFVKSTLAFLPANIGGYDLSNSANWPMVGFNFVLALLTGLVFAPLRRCNP